MSSFDSLTLAQDDSAILVVTSIRVLNRLYLLGGGMPPPYEIDARDDSTFIRASDHLYLVGGGNLSSRCRLRLTDA